MSLAARPPWAERRVAIVGLGQLGTACARAVPGAPGLSLAALVRRSASLAHPLPIGIPPTSAAFARGSVSGLSEAVLRSSGRRRRSRGQRALRRVEQRLREGIYRRGPRRGQPFDAPGRADYEQWAERLRETIARNRARAARAARRLGLPAAEPWA